ncbi:MAG: hypothetical protein HC895_08460 [Leptolyngbyaceae cyanobacterium SM1_3_5]|nr:hypothetical protein [Leptolyngbyaceae cyanobacterium SM1_3_5]
MTWRGSSTPLDRVYASLPYLLPLVTSLGFSAAFFAQFPALQVLFIPLAPLLIVYSFPFASLIIFFALFMLVVRNDRIPHFIRFNTMQAILLDIVLFLCSLIINMALAPALGANGDLLLDTLNNVVFLGTLVAVIYSVVQTAMGRYADIPTLSEAVYMQLPR